MREIHVDKIISVKLQSLDDYPIFLILIQLKTRQFNSFASWKSQLLLHIFFFFTCAIVMTVDKFFNIFYHFHYPRPIDPLMLIPNNLSKKVLDFSIFTKINQLGANFCFVFSSAAPGRTKISINEVHT